MRVVAKIQMEKWNGDVLDIKLRYSVVPLWKRKQSALKLLEIDIPGLDQVLGHPGATLAQFQETAHTFFLPLYGQKGCTTMNDARAHIYRGHKKPPPLKKRPPTDANLQLHVLRAHLQMLLWKAADNVIHLKKLEILPTLVGTSKAQPSHRPSQQRQLLPKHYWMSLAVAALQSTRHAVAHSAAATAQAFHARTTATAREERSAVVLSSASRWILKTTKGAKCR